MFQAHSRRLRLGWVVAALHVLATGTAAAGPLPPAADGQDVDPAVRPGDDFHAFANNVWLSTMSMPASRSRYDTTAMLRDEAGRRIRTILETAATAPASADARRLGDYYASWLDTATIEARGFQPVAADLAIIAGLKDRAGLSAWLGGQLQLDNGSNGGSDSLLGLWVHQGFEGETRYIAHFTQGGLGPNRREIYLEATAALAAYRKHVVELLGSAGFDEPGLRADRVIALETAIARTHASRADTDDVFKTNNIWSRQDLDQRAPGMDWSAFLHAARLDNQESFNLWQPGAVSGAAALVASEPLAAWKDYLAFHHLQRYAAVLPAAASTPPDDRVQVAVDAATAAMGQQIGRIYVEQYFPPESKAAAATMAENLKAAFRGRIAGLAWMTPATRATALEKLDTLQVGVGYPDNWIDYKDLAVSREDAIGNLRRAETFAYDRQLANLGRPVDVGEWTLVLPQWPGAVLYFSPNAMQFSAGLLQPPYFDPGGDAATNYGSAGAGMAHEISHTFDELGSIYDPQGRLAKWWTAEDSAAYDAAMAPLAAQLAAYCLEPELCVNADLVLAETTSDLAGLVVAYDAYRSTLNGEPDTVIDGLTGDQRFFLSFARRWRRLQTDQAQRQQFETDNHAPGPYRAGTVRNMDEWVRAWQVQPGDALYLEPEARVRIW